MTALPPSNRQFVVFPCGFGRHFLTHFRRLSGRNFWLRERVFIERIFLQELCRNSAGVFLLQFATGVETARASFFRGRSLSV